MALFETVSIFHRCKLIKMVLAEFAPGLVIPRFESLVAFAGESIIRGRFILVRVTAADFAVAAEIVRERFDDQHCAGWF